jgi:putative ubiquitin-RnfH superfamily antitoxin RatB of RatAB toxin-antitoxin module
MADTSPAAATPLAELEVCVCQSPAPGEVLERCVRLSAPATVADALQAAGLAWQEGQACGIWGRVCDAATLLHHGDRVELYRPLTVDPKVARRERFAQQGARRSGLFAKRRANSKAGY